MLVDGGMLKVKYTTCQTNLAKGHRMNKCSTDSSESQKHTFLTPYPTSLYEVIVCECHLSMKKSYENPNFQRQTLELSSRAPRRELHVVLNDVARISPACLRCPMDSWFPFTLPSAELQNLGGIAERARGASERERERELILEQRSVDRGLRWMKLLSEIVSAIWNYDL
jgi:hypothetical protein